MSRAFVKDESWEEPRVPPRAPLPEGVPNYVTPRGLVLLREELAGLEARRQAIEADASLDDEERRRRGRVVSLRLRDLHERIASAEVVPRATPPPDTARFGALVTLLAAGPDGPEGEPWEFQIVGVDEADPDDQKFAFTSPIAKAVLGARVGDTVRLESAGGSEALWIDRIEYPED